MLRPGLCSVTFRALGIDEVVRRTAEAGLESIEWAGDVHVPPGDPLAARTARALTEQAGLAVASYGSYLRFEGADGDVRAEGDAVITTARALGAPRIRVWAGDTGSADVPERHRAHLVRRIRAFADAAAGSGLQVGLEFHGRTLTDEVGSTQRLLTEIDRETVRTYWQPPVGRPAAEALATLRRVLPRASTIHAFSWWPAAERLPLAERAGLWRDVVAMLAEDGSDRDVLLEFVPGDDPAVLPREAATLRGLLTAAEETTR